MYLYIITSFNVKCFETKKEKWFACIQNLFSNNNKKKTKFYTKKGTLLIYRCVEALFANLLDQILLAVVRK